MLRWIGWRAWSNGTGSRSCWRICGMKKDQSTRLSGLVLFRALLLQSLYGLSDRELEEALGDRLSFKRFVGLSLEDTAPDHTVLNRFRNQFVELGLLEKLFGELDRQLENAGLILKRGTMLDATVIQAISAPPKEDRPSNDPDARFTKRQGKSGSTFGYKAHMGVDEGSSQRSSER